MFFLEDENIGLRGLLESDADGCYADWFNDINICKFNSHHRYPMTRDEVFEYIKQSNRDNKKLILAVIEKKQNIHIGNISLQQIDYINRQAELALIFGEKDYWGRGYATAAAGLLIKHAFNELGLNRIYFGTSERNKAMQKVGEHLYFSRIGIEREALYKNGEFLNIYKYDLLRKEWMSNN